MCSVYIESTIIFSVFDYNLTYIFREVVVNFSSGSFGERARQNRPDTHGLGRLPFQELGLSCRFLRLQCLGFRLRCFLLGVGCRFGSGRCLALLFDLLIIDRYPLGYTLMTLLVDLLVFGFDVGKFLRHVLLGESKEKTGNGVVTIRSLEVLNQEVTADNRLFPCIEVFNYCKFLPCAGVGRPVEARRGVKDT